jgi:hypothetical protein
MFETDHLLNEWIAGKIVRLQNKKNEALRRAASSPGAADLAHLSQQVAYLEGKIDGLQDVLEKSAGEEAATLMVMKLLDISPDA